MNTPTPAQALDEVMAALDTVTDGDYLSRLANGERIAMKCVEVIRQHGQHFAGLEAEVENARETLAKALDAGGVNDEPLRTLVVRASNALYWRSQLLVEKSRMYEAAEARCAELEARVERLRDKNAEFLSAWGKAAVRANDAESRLAEAVGLLLDAAPFVDTDPDVHCHMDADLHQRISAFLAANGDV